RFNHPPSVRDEIFKRIEAERRFKADFYRSEGDREAQNIRSAAEQKRRELLAEARAEEKRRKGEAETEADRIRSAAHSQDPDSYVFLKKLEKMKSILGENKALLLLSTHRPIFDLLFQPPQPGRPLPPGVSAAPAGQMPMPGGQAQKKGGQ